MGEEVAVWVAAGAGALAVACLGAVIWMAVALRRVRAEQRVLLPDGAQAGLVERQATLVRAQERLAGRVDGIATDLTRLAAEADAGLRRALRVEGTVRYDAFADTGGHQSWSVALLDASRTGAVVTSLNARDGARLYLKQVAEGVPDQPLSPEEQQAVAAATAGAPLGVTVPGSGS